MKKNVMIAMMLALNIFYPTVSQAYASSLEDSLVQIAAQDSRISNVQELIKIKQQLDQGKTDALISAVAQNALGKKEQGNIMATAVSSNIISVAQEGIRQKLGQRIEEQLVAHKDEVDILSLLLKEANILTPSVEMENNSLTGAPENYRRVMDMTATAYASGPLDNGKWNNQTYMGGLIQKGVVAVDPRIIPMGTKLWVEGYGEAIAADQGSAIQGNRIDLAFNTRQEALDYGIKNIKVYTLN